MPPNKNGYCSAEGDEQHDTLLGPMAAATTTTTTTEAPEGKAFHGAARQVLLVGILSASIIHAGFLQGWTAALPKMQQDQSKFSVTESDVTWLVSMTAVFGIVSSFTSGPLQEIVGPRRLHLLVLAPSVAVWLVMAFTPYKSLLYVGRAATAFCSYTSDALMQPLVAELSPARLRGMTLSLPEISGSLGMLVMYFLTFLAPWDVATALCSVFLFCCVLGVLFVPESPYWLVRRGRLEEARVALQRLLSNDSKAVEEQFAAITSSPFCTQESVKEQFRALRERHNLVPTLLVLSLFVLREVGGRSCVMMYTVYIFREAGVQMDAFTCTVMLGGVRVFFSCVSGVLLDHTGRRPLLIATAALAAVSQGVCGLFLCLQLPWASSVTLVAVLLYVGFYSLGCGPIPWVYVGELLPSPVRSIAASIIVCTFNAAMFVINYAFFTLVTHLSIGGLLLFFAASNLFIAIIVWLWLPETRKVSLETLEKAFYPENRKVQTTLTVVEGDTGKKDSVYPEAIP